MKLFSIFKKKPLKRTAPNPFSYDDDYIPPSLSGVRVTPETALKLSAVYACVRVISDTIASIPLLPYTAKGDSQNLNRKDPLYNLLVKRPNPWQSSFDFFRQQMCFLLLRGNAFSEVIFKRGDPVMLVPLHPSRMAVELDSSGSKIYKFRTMQGTERLIPTERMLHFKGMSCDGIVGLSVIDDIARQSVGLGLAQEEYGARSFGQRSNIAGVLHHPGKLDDIAHARIKKSWNDAYSGLANSHKIAITEEGMKFEPISMTNESAQFLEARKFQVEEICRIFRVPPHKIMDLSNAHFNNLEHSNADFREGLVPWATCIEQEIDYILIGPDETDSRFVRFNLNALLRADTLTRAQVQNLRLSNGMQSINEARQEEDWNPIGPEGDVHRIQLNTGAAGNTAAGNPAEPGSQPGADQPQAKIPEPKPSGNRSMGDDFARMKYAYARSLEECVSRVCRREAAEWRNEIKRNRSFNDENFKKFTSEWAETYEKLLSEAVRSTIFAWVESVIFYENIKLPDDAKRKTLQKSDNSSFLATHLSKKWGKSYGENSKKEWETRLKQQDLSEIPDQIERNRARIEAEQWIELIEAEVIEELNQ